MKLYIVRHGETMFNVKRIVQGWCDSPLTAKGRMQAKACGIGLEDVPFIAAYCSTSERTLDTALGILAGRDLAVQPLKALKEMNFGEAEGEPMSEWFDSQDAIQEIFASCGGETFAEAGQRALSAWKAIAEKHDEGNVLIVTHGAVIMAGMQALTPEETARQLASGHAPENCSVTILEYTGDSLMPVTVFDTSFREKGEGGQV